MDWIGFYGRQRHSAGGDLWVSNLPCPVGDLSRGTKSSGPTPTLCLALFLHHVAPQIENHQSHLFGSV
jgi:hypothetical protein